MFLYQFLVFMTLEIQGNYVIAHTWNPTYKWLKQGDCYKFKSSLNHRVSLNLERERERERERENELEKYTFQVKSSDHSKTVPVCPVLSSCKLSFLFVIK